MQRRRYSGNSKRGGQKRIKKELQDIFRQSQISAISLSNESHSSPDISTRTINDDSAEDLSFIFDAPVAYFRNLKHFLPVGCAFDNLNSAKSFEFDFLQVCVESKLGRTVVNRFLKVFAAHKVGNFPLDARSCLGSLRKVETDVMHPGEYFHFGLEVALNQVLKFVEIDTQEIQLQVNVDGLELSRSSPVNFWPILCRAIWKDFVSEVFIVGLYCGEGKPASSMIFLRKFVNDVLNSLTNGISVKNLRYRIKIHSIICDAPARQFVKCIKSHSSYYSCERCTIEGQSIVKVGVRYFSIENCVRRTNESFRRQMQVEHHVSADESPFLQMPIDMVADFPLDYMHLVLLGVVKRMLQLWHGIRFNKTAYSHMHRLNGIKRSVLNNRVRIAAATVPLEFQRKPRPFTYLGMFKATEYRMFLCYTSPLLLYNLFQCRSVQGHFMLLVVSLRIFLSSNQSEARIKFADVCVKAFVDSFRGFYGKAQMVYNVHCIKHLVEDYIRFGNLDSVSCFPYESFMCRLKHLVTRPGKQLAQVVKRLHEKCNFALPQSSDEIEANLKNRHFNGPTGPYSNDSVKQFQEVIFLGKTLKLDDVNDIIHCGLGFGKVVNILWEDNHVILLCALFRCEEDVFLYPCKSRDVGICFVSRISESVVNVHVREVVKCWGMKCPWNCDKLYVVKLLHHGN